MNSAYNLQTTIESRKSVRLYDDRPLSDEDKNLIVSYIDKTLEEPTPFKSKMRVHYIEAKPGTEIEKLGTYGVIKGTKTFLCVTTKDEEGEMEAIGYNFEKIVLYLTSIGIGTCYLAGTFKREQFLNAINVKDDEIFPIVCPIGYPKDGNSLINKIFRKVAKSDQRMKWDEIFFDGDFAHPLTKEKANEYEFPLEMFRLAPSAANKQPWRIVYKDNYFHFFKVDNPKSKYPYDLQKLDVGIATCHFSLAAKDKSLNGEFIKLDNFDIDIPEGISYLYSWKMAI